MPQLTPTQRVRGVRYMPSGLSSRTREDAGVDLLLVQRHQTAKADGDARLAEILEQQHRHLFQSTYEGRA